MDDFGVPADGRSAPARHRRAWVLTAAAVLVVLLSGAGMQSHGTTGPSALDTATLRPAYHGQVLTPADVSTLQAEGLAKFGVVNRELACQGVELYFDTTAERDAYVADYAARFPVEPPYVYGDPCQPFRDSPRFLDGN